MPEGDTLYRTAAALRPHLLGRPVAAAAARQPGPRVERLVGATVESVDSRGKQLLIRFDCGLELRTHLGLHGSWHRYAPGERWRRPPSRARVVLEVAGSVAVCFDAPTVELFETRAEAVHPVLARLGPDLLAETFDEAALDEIVHRLRRPDAATVSVAEALLDQRALAGIGNVYKSEVLFLEGIQPFRSLASLDDAALRRLAGTARRLLLANRTGGARVTTGGAGAGGAAAAGAGAGGRSRASGRLWVYGRAGRPCRRCGAIIETRRQGASARRTFWCPRCQPDEEA